MTTTILVVDDQSSVRHLLQEYLAEQGFRVLTATDGQHALAVARHDPPDLILLDIMMPKMDGYQFLRTYRQERQTPIIIITAREEETDAVLGLDLGADDYIIKPCGNWRRASGQCFAAGKPGRVKALKSCAPPMIGFCWTAAPTK